MRNREIAAQKIRWECVVCGDAARFCCGDDDNVGFV
jgi:hypothetical protein